MVSGEEGKVTRLTKSGGPHNFTAGPGSGTNVISGFSFEFPSGRVRRGRQPRRQPLPG